MLPLLASERDERDQQEKGERRKLKEIRKGMQLPLPLVVKA